MVPDKSVLKGQKMVENAKIRKIKCDILSNFQTMCPHLNFLDARVDKIQHISCHDIATKV